MSAIHADHDPLEQLRAQVARIEGRPSQHSPEIPTHPALSELLQLRAGASYAVDSASLAIAMMAGPSAGGAWCAIVGSAEISLPAAAAAGVVLDRTIVVPDPADQWPEVLAALIDAVQIVVLCPPARVSESVSSRLSARLRARGSVLVVWGHWPRCQARLTITDSTWHGLGRGHGHLQARQATVAVQQTHAPARTARLWLPDDHHRIRTDNVHALRSTG